MKYLGIDYGRARIGVAVGDDETNMAFPRPIFETTDETEMVRGLSALAAEEGAGEIVMGLPSLIQGIDSAIRAEIMALRDRIKTESGIPVHLEDEMFTTKIAREHTKQSAVDSAAAALILQSFLDKRMRR